MNATSPNPTPPLRLLAKWFGVQQPGAVTGDLYIYHKPAMFTYFFFFFLRSSIGGVAYVAVFNSSATWAATFRLRGYKCMLAIVVFP